MMKNKHVIQQDNFATADSPLIRPSLRFLQPIDCQNNLSVLEDQLQTFKLILYIMGAIIAILITIIIAGLIISRRKLNRVSLSNLARQISG